jgi:hypothetical protein
MSTNASKKTDKKTSSKPQKLKPVTKSSSLITENNLKLVLVGAGILLLTLVPIVGFFVLLGVAIRHFKKH